MIFYKTLKVSVLSILLIRLTIYKLYYSECRLNQSLLMLSAANCDRISQVSFAIHYYIELTVIDFIRLM